jgi:uroporphyrinogen decarboxylase
MYLRVLQLLFRLIFKRPSDGRYTTFKDEFGIGWRMPKEDGLYYDMFDHPLSGDITEEDVENYPLPDPLDPSRFANLRHLHRRCWKRNNAP